MPAGRLHTNAVLRAVTHAAQLCVRLAALQGLAAGLMLCISVFDLMPEAVAEVGFATANAWFFAGVAFFAAVVHFIPEPSSEGLVLDEEPAAKDAVVSVPATAPAAMLTRR
jgi:hypothetical protein